MSTIVGLLVAIILLLVFILIKVIEIGDRLRERFPTEREQDRDWAQKDPMGYWEAHRDKPKTQSQPR